MSGLRRMGAWWVFSGVMLACSDDAGGDGAKCGEDPCGGDVVGTWQIAEACGLETLYDSLGVDLDGCPDALVEISELDFSGPVSFDAAGNYSMTMSLSGSFRMTVPVACLTSGDVTLTCEQLNAALQPEPSGNPDVPFQSVNCTGSGACSCLFQLQPEVVALESGTYATSGNTLTITSSSGETTENTYCVSGSTLTLDAEPQTIDGQTVNPTLIMNR